MNLDQLACFVNSEDQKTKRLEKYIGKVIQFKIKPNWNILHSKKVTIGIVREKEFSIYLEPDRTINSRPAKNTIKVNTLQVQVYKNDYTDMGYSIASLVIEETSIIELPESEQILFKLACEDKRKLFINAF